MALEAASPLSIGSIIMDMTAGAESISLAAGVAIFAVYFGRFVRDLTIPVKDLVIAMTKHTATKTARAEEALAAVQRQTEFQTLWTGSITTLLDRLAAIEGRLAAWTPTTHQDKEST